MKTIKELEAEPMLVCRDEAYLEALKDVLGLIDEIDLECSRTLDEVKAKRILKLKINGEEPSQNSTKEKEDGK